MSRYVISHELRFNSRQQQHPLYIYPGKQKGLCVSEVIWCQGPIDWLSSLSTNLLDDTLHFRGQSCALPCALLVPGVALSDFLHNLLEVKRSKACSSYQRGVKHCGDDESEAAPWPWPLRSGATQPVRRRRRWRRSSRDLLALLRRILLAGCSALLAGAAAFISVFSCHCQEIAGMCDVSVMWVLPLFAVVDGEGFQSRPTNKSSSVSVSASCLSMGLFELRYADGGCPMLHSRLCIGPL